MVATEPTARAGDVLAAGATDWRTACFLALRRAFCRRCRWRFLDFFDAVIAQPSAPRDPWGLR